MRSGERLNQRLFALICSKSFTISQGLRDRAEVDGGYDWLECIVPNARGQDDPFNLAKQKVTDSAKSVERCFVLSLRVLFSFDCFCKGRKKCKGGRSATACELHKKLAATVGKD